MRLDRVHKFGDLVRRELSFPSEGRVLESDVLAYSQERPALECLGQLVPECFSDLVCAGRPEELDEVVPLHLLRFGVLLEDIIDDLVFGRRERAQRDIEACEAAFVVGHISRTGGTKGATGATYHAPQQSRRSD